MSNNVSYSAVIEYQTKDNTKDIIWYDFNDMETLEDFKNILPSLELPIEGINYYKFVFNVNRVIELEL